MIGLKRLARPLVGSHEGCGSDAADRTCRWWEVSASGARAGPYRGPVTIEVPERTKVRSTLAVGAALTFVNLTALMAELIAFVNYDAGSSVGSDLQSLTDVWYRYAVALILHAAVTGGILAAWPRSRAAGLGLLMGTAAAAALLLAFVVTQG